MPSLPSRCPGCDSEVINSGFLWLSNGKAELCCTKRCALRAQRRLQELRDGAPRCAGRRKPRAHAPTPPPDDVPIEAETGWASLNAEVLFLVGSRLGGLRDRLSAALVCRHWREQLTKGATHARLVMEDCDGPSGGVEAAVGLLDSGRALMPQVRSVDVSVPWRCRGPDSLLRQVHALSRWTQLQSLSVEWDVPEGEAALVAAAAVVNSVTGASAKDGRQPAVLSALCLGALGRLTGLRRLSLAARLGGCGHTGKSGSGPPGVGAGLYALSALTRLTELELRQPPLEARGTHTDDYPAWSSRDGDLSALTALRSLTASAEIASPPLLEGLQACSRLTRLVLTDVNVYAYGRYDNDENRYYGWDRLTDAVGGLTQLRFLHVAFATMDSDRHDPRTTTSVLTSLVEALKKLSAKQAQAQQAQALPGAAQAQGQAQGQGGNASPRPRPGAGSTPRASLTGGPDDLDDDDTAPAPGPCGPLEIEIDLRPALPKGCAHAASTSSPNAPVVTPMDSWTRARARQVAPRAHLDEELVEGLAGLTGMRRLELDFASGGAGNLARLASLTRLTHLELRCAPACRPALDSWDVQRLASSLPHLTTLALELPADCLTAAALERLNLFPALTSLDLTAHALVRQVPYSRWEVRGRLLGLGAREFGAGSADAPPPGLVVEVGRCLEALMGLQQLYVALEDVAEVQSALQSEAEWRRQQALDAAAAAAALIDDAAADVLAFFAAAAGAPAVEGPPALPPPEQVAEAALAEAMPSIPAWALLPLDDPSQEPDANAAAAAVWLAGFSTTASALAVRAALEAGPDFAAAPRVPLHELSREQLVVLRTLLLREELVTGPLFRVGAWVPRGLQELKLCGFAGLSFGAAAPHGAGVAGAGADASRLVAMACLRRIEVEVATGEACGATTEALMAWAAARGRAPSLQAAVVRVADAEEL
ncbi:hypothetical protein HYH03_001639 [Edaphochlamys debaryana]|uniref:F-box domain-containing protein n=1 Tax=Edaphochlamys debaryana TaxID=47281 RepID=A0A835YFN4_9CHLO|nr:hypothetical protein HYH03_001639 [Edaphochlamys debaryana]|eukprot:KAG2500879.1 hypothetical protein HYH03_001639 [Edaphochlamys debaryana]